MNFPPSLIGPVADFVLTLLRELAVYLGGDPDKAECWACQRHPELRPAAERMREARERAKKRTKGK